MTLTLPVATTHAWTFRTTKIYFSGYATFLDVVPDLEPDPFGDCLLFRGTQVWFTFTSSDPGMTGTNPNTLNLILKPDQSQFMWGTNVFTSDCENIQDRVVGQATPDGMLTSTYVGYGNGFKVLWQYQGNMMEGSIS